MEEISESLHATKLKKTVSFSISSIGKQQVASDFDDYIVSVESKIEPPTFEIDTICEFVSYTKSREIHTVKQPKDFPQQTDLILFNRKSSSMYDENIEKNKEELIKSGITTNLSLLNTKENKAELNASALRQRSAEISEIGGSGLVARMRARVLAEKPSTLKLDE